MDTTFTSVLTVAVPVTDQDATKALLLGLGFVEKLDQELQPGFRWVELSLPDGATSVSLVHVGPALPAGIDTGVRLGTPDAKAAHEALGQLGLHVGELLDWPGVPLMFEFEDLDANRWYVTQTG